VPRTGRMVVAEVFFTHLKILEKLLSFVLHLPWPVKISFNFFKKFTGVFLHFRPLNEEKIIEGSILLFEEKIENMRSSFLVSTLKIKHVYLQSATIN
jgi:hypothetical protein